LKTSVYRRPSLPRWGRKRVRWLNTHPILAAGTVTLTSKTNTTVALSATDAAGGYTPYSYQWERSATGGGSGFSNVSGQTTRNLSDSGLTSNTTYYYRLKYTDANSTVVYSAEYQTTTDYSGGVGASVIGCAFIRGAA
jgi:hypothetical protein